MTVLRYCSMDVTETTCMSDKFSKPHNECVFLSCTFHLSGQALKTYNAPVRHPTCPLDLDHNNALHPQHNIDTYSTRNKDCVI